MSPKSLTQILVLLLLLLVSFASPGNARAWSGCGNSYVVQWGDSLSTIAAACGTTVSALYAANPGISGYLYAGQVLAMPGGGGYYSDTYVVQYGDTFAKIAQRFGVSVNALWAANPYIWDINHIYAGQVIYVPTSSNNWFHVLPTSTEPLVERSYGSAPLGTPTGKVKLINNANAEAYISLQGTTKDGVKVINEYPVSDPLSVKVPIGWYHYVAWVGGEKFTGNFTLRKDSNYSIKLYINRVVVE